VRRAYAELGLLKKASSQKPKTTGFQTLYKRYPNLSQTQHSIRARLGLRRHLREDQRPGFCLPGLLMDVSPSSCLSVGTELVHQDSTLTLCPDLLSEEGSPEIHHSDQ